MNTLSENSITIRKAKIEEVDQLTELALESKSYWPYTQEFLEKCVDDLTLNPQHVVNGLVYILELDSNIVGYYAFEKIENNELEMIALFVDPKFVGKGYGHKLWQHAADFAKELGYCKFKVVADPYAADHFYYKQGCIKVGDFESSVEKGRILPLLEFRL